MVDPAARREGADTVSLKWSEYRIAYGPMPKEEARSVAHRLGPHYFIEELAEGWCVLIHMDNDKAKEPK